MQPPIAAARAAIQDGELERALDIIRSGLADDPEDEQLALLGAALLRRLKATLRRKVRERDYPEIIAVAAALLDDEEAADSAAEALIGAARASLPAKEFAALLMAVSDRRSHPRIWKELGRVLHELPVTPRTIEKGFEILTHLPGNDAVLSDLADLVMRLRTRPEALDGPEE